MNSYKNNTVYSDSDISYDIKYSCSENVTCEISKNSGIIYSSKHTDSFIVTITPKVNLNDGEKATINLETTSSSPYKKTLKGKFNVVVGKLGLSYEINDSVGNPFFEVAVTNTLDYYVVRNAFNGYSVGDKVDIKTFLSFSEMEKNNCASSIVTIDFSPNNVLLDMTSTAYFKVDALSSYKVKFYKKDSTKDYTYPFTNSQSIVNVNFD